MSCTCGRTSQMPDKHASPMPKRLHRRPPITSSQLPAMDAVEPLLPQPDDTMFRRAVRGKASPDDSADATQLIKSGAPIAFPTCGSQPDRP